MFNKILVVVLGKTINRNKNINIKEENILK